MKYQTTYDSLESLHCGDTVKVIYSSDGMTADGEDEGKVVRRIVRREKKECTVVIELPSKSMGTVIFEVGDFGKVEKKS